METATGTIGDFGCTLYRGSDHAIKEHLQDVWNVTVKIAGRAEIGMPFSELYAQALELIQVAGFENKIYSAHDGNNTNIGHTVPWSEHLPTDQELKILQAGSPEQIADLVGNARRFVSATEPLRISEELAFTIEPRLSRPDRPTAWFHLVVGFENKSRVVVTEFDPLFDLFEMQGFTIR